MASEELVIVIEKGKRPEGYEINVSFKFTTTAPANADERLFGRMFHEVEHFLRFGANKPASITEGLADITEQEEEQKHRGNGERRWKRIAIAMTTENKIQQLAEITEQEEEQEHGGNGGRKRMKHKAENDEDEKESNQQLAEMTEQEEEQEHRGNGERRWKRSPNMTAESKNQQMAEITEQEGEQEHRGNGERKRMKHRAKKDEGEKKSRKIEGDRNVANPMKNKGQQQEKEATGKEKQKQQKDRKVQGQREEAKIGRQKTEEKKQQWVGEGIVRLKRGGDCPDQGKREKGSKGKVEEKSSRSVKEKEDDDKKRQQLPMMLRPGERKAGQAGQDTGKCQDSRTASTVSTTQPGGNDVTASGQTPAVEGQIKPERSSNVSCQQGRPGLLTCVSESSASRGIVAAKTNLAALDRPPPRTLERNREESKRTDSSKRNIPRAENRFPPSGLKRNVRIGGIEILVLMAVLSSFVTSCSASAGHVSLHVEVRGLAVQGDPYTLTCVVTPAPASHTTSAYTWYRDGHVLHNHTGRVLAFTTVSKRDEGHYQCGLNLGSLQLSNPFSLRVIVFEKLSMVPEVEVEEGQTVILNCSVHSDPTAFLNWRVDGELVLTVRSNSYGLVLHNASRRHLSVVECQARNNALHLGFMSTYTLIRIKGTYEIIPRPWLGPRGTPVVHRPFGMECLVMDIPNSGVNVHLTYTWYKDHKVMEGQSDMILDIPSVTREDSGLYTCTARNGRAETTSLESNALEVVVLVPPVVHMEPQTPDTTVLGAAGHNLTLTCKVTEAFPGVAPDGYRWSYLPSPQAQLRPLEGRESTLTLGPLTREDRGQYFCQAWNYEDFDGLLPPGNASVTVDVLCLGPIILTPDLQVNEGEPVNLTCHVDCDPSFRLAWTVGGAKVRHVTAKVDHYIILSAACSDSQTYTCGASHPDLPGLEIHASTHILVNCGSPAEVNVTTKFHANTTEPVPAEWNTTALAIALPIVVIALAVIIVVVVCIVRKRRERCCDAEADKKDKEKEPMNVWDRPTPQSAATPPRRCLA